MAATLHGELTADDSQIILIATGMDWEVNQMALTLQHITPVVKPSNPKGALLVPASWPAVCQLAYTFDGQGEHGWWAPSERLKTWTQNQFTRRTASDLIPLQWTGTDGRTPRQYQLDGAKAIASTGRFLVCDEPGCGKSAVALLGLAWRQYLGIEIFPVVVIVPSWDVADAWAREAAIWFPSWRMKMWGGPDRLRNLRFRAATDMYITTYATARIDAPENKVGPLVKLKPAAVVLDEIHFCKNQDAQQSKSARRIAAGADTIIGLSGTPITRNTGDLWPCLAALEPVAWPTRKRFVDRYCQTGQKDYGAPNIEGLNRGNEPEFRAALTGQYRRVAKSDVLTQLPPKIYSVRRVEIPPEWRKAYETMERDMLAQLPDGEEIPVMSVLAQMTRLAQLAASAADVTESVELDDDGLERIHYHVDLREPSWKIDVLMEILGERPGQQTVVFAPYRQLVMLAGARASKAGYRVGYVAGGIAKGARTAAIKAFQAGELDVLCASTGAGGTGITLTAASTAVFLQRPWPLAEALQAEDRIHRIGSEIHRNGVEIIDIVARKTIDSRVRERLREKGGQLADFVRDPRIVRELLGGIQ